MDNEMIERCMQAHYNEYMKEYGDDAVLIEEQSSASQEKLKRCIVASIEAMRTPTENVLMKVSEAILACPNASDYERLVAVKAVEAMLDAIVK